MDAIKALIKRLTIGRGTPEPAIPEQPPRNYTQERETTRSGVLSAEDQAWKADRRQRDQTAHQKD